MGRYHRRAALGEQPTGGILTRERADRFFTRAPSRRGGERVSVLEDIILGVREDLEDRQRSVSIDELKRKASRARDPRDAYAALGGDRVSVIAEVKRSSPSKGALA